LILCFFVDVENSYPVKNNRFMKINIE